MEIWMGGYYREGSGLWTACLRNKLVEVRLTPAEADSGRKYHGLTFMQETNCSAFIRIQRSNSTMDLSRHKDSYFSTVHGYIAIPLRRWIGNVWKQFILKV
jgi:hypothetical protein